jgi:hypothetical protein
MWIYGTIYISMRQLDAREIYSTQEELLRNLGGKSIGVGSPNNPGSCREPNWYEPFHVNRCVDV